MELSNDIEIDERNEVEEEVEINKEKDLIIDQEEITNLKMKKKPTEKKLSFEKNNDAKNNLINYLNSEKQLENHGINEIVDNIESQSDIKGNNYFDNFESSDFNSQKNITDDHFITNLELDTYSFDPVPTDEKEPLSDKICTNLINDENKPIFDNVAAFDDLDFNYAEF
tara:strand:- start:155 stop:661 length:507 start_codon:yes stop_codon:yes gene_type:complete